MKLFLSAQTERSKNKLYRIGQVALRPCFHYAEGMLSVLIETRNNEEGLARSLASLVTAAVEGMVREVLVCDLGSTDGTHTVADHSGCLFLQGGWPVGIRQARGDWLLLLEPGARLLAGWTDEVREHLAQDGGPARFTRSRLRPLPIVARFAAPGLRDGLLIQRDQARQLISAGHSPASFAGRFGARRLEAEIVRAG